MKDERSLNTTQCDKHKLKENESRRNPDKITEPGDFDDKKHDLDKNEDQQPVEESRKKESKLSPLMKIEEKFRGKTVLFLSYLDSIYLINPRFTTSFCGCMPRYHYRMASIASHSCVTAHKSHQ